MVEKRAYTIRMSIPAEIVVRCLIAAPMMPLSSFASKKVLVPFHPGHGHFDILLRPTYCMHALVLFIPAHAVAARTTDGNTTQATLSDRRIGQSLPSTARHHIIVAASYATRGTMRQAGRFGQTDVSYISPPTYCLVSS